MTSRTRWRVRRALSRAVLAVFIGGAGIETAGAASLTLAWDPSPDPAVVGYRVYVGTDPGVYAESYDVGARTSFVYQPTTPRVYHFAVAAYVAGPLIGPLSSPVSGYTSNVPAAPDPPLHAFPEQPVEELPLYDDYWPWEVMGGRRSSTRSAPPVVCWQPPAQDCLTVQTLARLPSTIASLAAAEDGRLFFIECGRQIRVIASEVLVREPVLIERRPSVVLNQIAVDAEFPRTGVMYVGETETRADGRREFSVARYRLVQNIAGERATIIPGIPLPPSGDARLAVDADGHLYVAVPGISTPGHDGAYAGSLLRFSTDGTVPQQNRGSSPIVGRGYAEPTAIAASVRAEGLWLAGGDVNAGAPVAHYDFRHGRSRSWPGIGAGAGVTSIAVRDRSDGAVEVFSVSTAGLVERGRVDGSGAIASTQQLSVPSSTAASLALAPGGAVYVAVEHGPPATRSEGWSIVRLIPAR